MKLLHLFTILLLTIALNAQDDFFEPGYSIGGYGELHWNRELNKDGETTKNQMDFHRFIIYYGYNWTEEWSFKSELELEHNFVSSADADVKDLNTDADNDPATNEEDTYIVKTSGYGELELEQAYVNYHTDNWGFQGGVILPTVGLINEYHEPPLFLSVERPDYNKYIIPTTWFGNGFAFYGNVGDFNLRIALMEDLEGEAISTNGIRSARGKGYKTTGYSLVKNMSAVYTGISGLRVGTSLTLNDAPIDNEPDTSISIQMFEVNAKYSANNIYAVFEFGQNSFDGNNTTTDYYDDAGNKIGTLKTSSGYYLDLGYNIGGMVNTNKLIPWLRVSNVSIDTDTDSKITDYMRFGLTWWPIDNIAFKMDYGTKTKKSDSNNPTTQINLGIGYNF